MPHLEPDLDQSDICRFFDKNARKQAERAAGRRGQKENAKQHDRTDLSDGLG